MFAYLQWLTQSSGDVRSRGGRPGLPVPNNLSLMIPVDVKQHWNETVTNLPIAAQRTEQKSVEEQQQQRRQEVDDAVHVQQHHLPLDPHDIPAALLRHVVAVRQVLRGSQGGQRGDDDTLTGSRAHPSHPERVGDGDVALHDDGDGQVGGQRVEDVRQVLGHVGHALPEEQACDAAEDVGDDGQGVGGTERQEKPGAAHRVELGGPHSHGDHVAHDAYGVDRQGGVVFLLTRQNHLCVCVCVCACARVRACARARVCVCVCERESS